MSKLLLGLTLLIIGDSHFVGHHHMIGALHDDLLAQGAKVYTYGACGLPPSGWVVPRNVVCGVSARLGTGADTESFDKAARNPAFDQLVQQVRPDLVIVAIGDPLASYELKEMPRTTISQSVTALTARIRAHNVPCVWVGPSWGSEGGPYFKTYARVKELSDALKDMVAPCRYVDTLAMAKPGEWPTFDGLHHTTAGYDAWARALTDILVRDPAVRAMAAH